MRTLKMNESINHTPNSKQKNSVWSSDEEYHEKSIAPAKYAQITSIEKKLVDQQKIEQKSEKEGKDSEKNQ